jgi:hypothetical protein
MLLPSFSQNDGTVQRDADNGHQQRQVRGMATHSCA